MTIWITSGTRPSNSRLALQRAGHFRKLKPDSIVRLNDYVINWGVSTPIGSADWKWRNRPSCVAVASNKLKTFEALDENDVSVVSWSDQKLDAQGWLDDAKTVVVRQVLTGHSGNGILIVKPDGTELPDAPLYTRYVFKTHEYRVHVVKSDVIDVQRKIKDPNRDVVDWKVRSHANGFIFARNNVDVSDDICVLAVNAVAALGLDFGAVDIVVDKHGKAYVLEINSAPGLEGQTVGLYATALRAACNGN